MKLARTVVLVGLTVFVVSGCMSIVSLDQPYEAEAGKEFITTIEARTPEAGEDEEETFAYGVFAFSVPSGWVVTGVETIGGDIKPNWKKIPSAKVVSYNEYEGDEVYPWTYFKTDDKYSTIAHANKTFTAEVTIKPSSSGHFELAYLSGTTEDPDSAGDYSPSWGTNEVNGGSVIFKRIWVE